MKLLALDKINYRILFDTEAIIESRTGSFTAVFARNSVAFGGICIAVTHLDIANLGKTIIIPYSVHTILSSHWDGTYELESLVFEFGSELQSIAPSAFISSQLKCVFVPGPVCSIGDAAFFLCHYLSWVSFDCQTSLWQLRSLIFSSCDPLRTITIPASVRQIHSSAFSQCKHLFSVTFELGSNCWYIASGAFDYCPLLKFIVLPPSVEVINPSLRSSIRLCIAQTSAQESSNFCLENDCFLSANGHQIVLSAGSFMLNSSLQTLVFGSRSRLKSLPASCFQGCVSLRSLQVPKSIRGIWEKCFSECSGLATVTFESPATIRKIGFSAFSDCSHLASFIVPSSVSNLGDCVFSGCSELSRVTFEARSLLASIPGRLFVDCGKLKALNLPDSVTTIASTALQRSGVTSVTGADCVICNSLLIRHEMILHCFGSLSQLVIPSIVREIVYKQFAQVRSLLDLSFEEGVVSIGYGAFENCFQLRTVAFPASLEVIGENAFSCCESLRHLTFAEGSQLRWIQKEAFAYVPLERVILPATVKEINPSAFTLTV
jgi:hypothetical protein